MSTLKTKITQHLIAKGSYCPDVDDYYVDELVQNIELAKQSLKDLREQGVTIPYRTISGSQMYKINPLVNIYQMFARNIAQLAGKLGISRNDRMKLKLIEAKAMDEFEKDMK